MTIYRYVPLKYIKALLQTKALFFSNVLVWEDPYENFLFKQQIITDNGDDFRKSIYCPIYFGQCWTTSRETDAMWRIYSVKSKDLKSDKLELEDVAIKIEIESDVLEYHVRQKFRLRSNCEVECREVMYTDSHNIIDAIKSVHYMEYYNVQELMKSSLFVKRKAFEHEREYRFIVQIPPMELDSQTSHLMIDFDVTAIKEYVVDPRLPHHQLKQIKSDLIRLKVDENKIKKSDLYHPIEKIKICVEKDGYINNNSQ